MIFLSKGVIFRFHVNFLVGKHVMVMFEYSSDLHVLHVLQVAPKVSDKKDEAKRKPPKRRFGEYRKGNPPKNAQTLPNRLMSYSAIPKLTWIHVTN